MSKLTSLAVALCLGFAGSDDCTRVGTTRNVNCDLASLATGASATVTTATSPAAAARRSRDTTSAASRNPSAATTKLTPLVPT